MVGARPLTDLEDAVVVDVGGTTTDIGVLRDGRPGLSTEGATLGGWRTRIRAVDVSTSGVGGDSRLVVIGSRVHPTPLHVMPLCMASSAWPVIRWKLEAFRGTRERWRPSMADPSSAPQSTEFYALNKRPAGEVLELVSQEPHSLYELAELLGVHPLALDLRRMETRGMVLRIGLTPTDIPHSPMTVGLREIHLCRSPGELVRRIP